MSYFPNTTSLRAYGLLTLVRDFALSIIDQSGLMAVENTVGLFNSHEEINKIFFMQDDDAQL